MLSRWSPWSATPSWRRCSTGGNKVEAARRLAMSRATIYRKIRDYGISLPASPNPAA